MRRLGLPLVVIALLVAASPAAAATFTVTGTTDVTGSCSGTSCTTIRAALAAAQFQSPVADTIVIPAGDYQLSMGQLDVDTPVTIVGAGARATIVRGTVNGPGVQRQRHDGDDLVADDLRGHGAIGQLRRQRLQRRRRRSCSTTCA